MTERMNRHGRASGSWAENIAYGNNDAIEIVMQLFIDDGVSSRGHRDNIVGAYGEVAVSNCCHSTYTY